jgi:hypothetical protein
VPSAYACATMHAGFHVGSIEIPRARNCARSYHVKLRSRSRVGEPLRKLLFECGDSRFCRAAALEFTRGVPLLERLRFVRRPRWPEACLDKFVRHRCPAETFSGRSNFRVVEQQIANSDVGLNLLTCFVAASFDGAVRIRPTSAGVRFVMRESNDK